MKFMVHMTVRKDGALGVGWAYSTQIDATDNYQARQRAIEFVREHHQLETLEIRDVSSVPDTSQPQ